MQVGLILRFPQLLPRCYPFQLILILVLILLNLVSSQDNKPPTFTATQYVFSVTENATIGSTLTPITGGVINATDEDDSSVVYQKVSESDAPQILLNSTSGALMVGSVLDRETTSFYSFPIVANDGNRGGAFLPTVSVQVVVLDVNDNKPVFVNSLYSFSIEEGVSNGHQVNPGNVPIAVTDQDIGNNENSLFSIVAGADGRFTIDPDGNIITDLDESAGVNRILDYETKPAYELTVRATNSESGPLGDSVFSEINVTVLLIDINDEVPIFSASSSDQAITISETSTGSLFTFQAEDTDHPLIATTFTYSITFGNGQINGADSFAINPTTGVLSVSASMLDHEAIPSYSLVIQAREDQTPRDTAVTTFTISVLDSNEFNPEFTPSSYSATISEISTVGEAVLLVEATDNDTSHTIIYSLDGVVDSTYFEIDSTSGLISVRREFDRETQDTFSFTVIAQDSLSTFLTATAAVAVFIGDVNDNSPVFRDDTQTIDYDEKSTSNVVIYNVPSQNPIVDLDQGVNGQVKYSFQAPSTTDFSIDPDSGNITVNAMLDYNTQPVYTLTIIATDQALVASTRRTGSFVLTINVIDVNDNLPVLVVIANQNVSENLPAGTFLFTVSASDLDAGRTTPLSLNITNSTAVPFVLTVTNIPSPTLITAQVATSKALDFETTSEKLFSITIVASDGDNTDSGVVTITTGDVNDNAPIFTQPGGYTFSINESQPGVTVIATTVTASDLDSNMFDPVVYSKVGDPEMNFMVDSNTGEVSVLNLLDADVFNVYRFSIVAADGGTPPLSTLVLITINVTDLNDLNPEFFVDDATVYIDENTVYSNIFTFMASDGDRTSPNNQFKFSITGSIPAVVNLSSIFVIGEDNGTIATNSILPNREQFTTGIILNVTVTDLGSGPLTDTASLTIVINDKNDNAPRFDMPSYTATLNEDFPTGESFLQVTASEVNADVNTQIIYSLVNQATASGNPMQYLSIDSLTGNITVAKSFDFEVLETLSLTLTATDGTFSDTSLLTVSILNVNDNLPLLSVTVCSTTLSENNSLSGFCSFSVSDADQDGTAQFTLDSSSFSIVPNLNEFSILYTDGAPNASLVLSSSLDFETIKIYTLTINIVDKGTAPNTASISLAITVTGVNEHAPAFAQGSYTFSMDESEDIDSLIGLVTATDMDDPSTLDGIFSYSIQSQASTFPFKIDSGTGAISLKTRVDYEVDTAFNFQVFATDSTIGNEKTGTTTVIITVFDSNENTPEFTTTFSASILENISIGVSVVQVIATDLDREDVITYSIIDPGSEFLINTTNGEISTNSMLDFEATQVYYLLVKAQDNGVPSREANTLVTITILDVNDNDPQFDRAPVNSQILEGLANTFILLVSAIDSDSTTNAEISYSVDPNTEFNMDPTSGRLSTRNALDREANPTFIIMICATDRGMAPRSVCGSVTITVLDVNDNFPSFDVNSITSVDIAENSAGGLSVATFTVSDPDQINSFFFILEDDGGPFSITSTSLVAEVTLSGSSVPLDREVRDLYSLVVTVNDGIHSTTHSFTVNVTDINDNIPSFELDAYIVQTEVLENSSFGTCIARISPVLTVLAIDNDIFPNNDVQYSLLDSADNRFGINASTGEIFVNDITKLDYESMQSHTLQVQSSDGTFTDSAIVYIPVGDVNDNPPNFFENSYNIPVLETSAIGTTILVVQAFDLDSGTNGEVIYEISSSDSNVISTFELSQSTGILKTRSTLDADSPPTQYIFNISATDLSNCNPLSSLVLVTVTLLEQNEDTPVFSSQLYVASVTEGVNSISSVLTVSASERDSNAVITYSILDVNARAVFSLDATTGVLSLIASLDREQIATFSFTVVASDSDTPPRQGFSSIQISIDDSNDNTPSFLLSKYSITLSESTSVNTIVLTAAATDGDATSAFNQIQFMFDSQGSAPFGINPTSGEISLTGALDFDSNSQNYTIGLNASDGTNIGIASLFIRITDENDIIPQINNTVLSVTLPENATAGTEVIDIDVDDEDTVGTITYSIISGDSNNLFVIDSSGRITLAGRLDFESITTYTLDILVSDGLHTITASVIVMVSNSNDHAPTFDRPLYQISLEENDLTDTFIILFIVTDIDSGDDGSLSLLIDSASNTGDMFNVTSSPVTNGLQGNIISRIPLDRETEGLTIASSTGAAVWTLNVIAHDNNANTLLRQTTTAEILITVTDINDNTPQFTFLPLTAQISESSNIGTPVLTLAATDADFGTNAQISFQLFNPSIADANKFSLNALSGELRTTVVLSRETNPTITIVVEATDGTLTASGTVTVTVTDINDHNPEFSATTVSVSIPENSPPGYLVTIVNATDEDDGDNGMITITILGGDPLDLFIVQNISSSTGRKDGQIEVAQDLIDRENQTFYELILVAEDGGVPARRGTATVTVIITDENDNSPLFSPSAYTATISEDASGRTPVALNTPVIVSDADQGIRSIFTLSLNDSSVFQISETRVVSLQPTAALDREVQSTFDLLIIATDMGSPMLSSNATLTISVIDINDNPPTFSPNFFEVSLLESATEGSFVANVSATDIDFEENGEISYSFFSGSRGNFLVDRSSGVIVTAGTLDRETTEIYNLVIVAFDSGTPFMSGMANVTVTVEDVNDNDPFFTQILYERTVAENQIGVLVIDLDASDVDKGENAVLIFDYQNPNLGSNLPFIINSSSGEISVNGLIDREDVDRYSFLVIVRDNASLPSERRTATANVIITISDVNDVAPFFPVDLFKTSIRETTLITTIVLFPRASDPDLGAGGDIIYSLNPESSIFSVDSSLGEIRLLQSLDIDSNAAIKQFNLTLVATDQGVPSLSGNVTVCITILDENDNVPIFSPPSSFAAILENTTIGYIFITLTATDNDTNGVIQYDIVGGNLLGLFKINISTGEVATNKTLFNLTSSIFELTVRAFESGDPTKSSLTSLHIEIADTNDNAPFFCQTAQYEFSVLENSATQTPVGQICGSDRDTGINGQFTFSILSGNVNSVFTIVQQAGTSTANIVVNSNALDRENIETYSLILQITDNGTPPLQSNTLVAKISILDENDGTPTFFNLPSMLDLDEDSFGGTQVFRVFANDTDLSSNAEVAFSIVNGDTDPPTFIIEPITGQITSIRPLDFNSMSTYTLVIRGADLGSPPNINQSTLVVNIIDVNNNAPVFIPPFETSIPEDFPNFSFVFLVRVTDADSTTNAELVYNISAGLNSFHFAINSSTGVITVNTTQLDRETQQLYNLEVTACDKGIPVMCSKIVIVISITDANDHPPVFVIPTFSFSVLENINIDYIVGRVIATDLDDGLNGMVEYTAIVGDPHFTISLDTGYITLLQSVDREIVSFYQLIIRAEDKGSTRMSANATVNITVLDVNDNAPIISTTIFSAQVGENAAPGTLVFDVDATDIDEGTNSRLTYSILGGHLGHFAINSISGEITVNNTLDAESTLRYEILILVSDSAFPPLTDVETLIINIIDINEHPPVFEEGIYYVDLPENSPSQTFLINVSATDADIPNTRNSEISFFLTGQDLIDFEVDSVSGMLTTKTTYDREVTTSLMLTIKANNPSTTPVLEGSAQIRITITDINDEIPYFTMTNFTAEVSELLQIGSFVLLLTAGDDDDPNVGNGRVSFSGSSQNSPEFDSSFRINSNGTVEVNGPLDRENLNLYVASAVVTDLGEPPLSNTSVIYITLTDENDVPPTFGSSTYNISYSEDIDPITQDGLPRLILQLDFTDGDLLNQYKESTFSIAANSPYSFPDFNINSDGDVFLNIGLDREIRDTYTLIAEVINTEAGHLSGSYCSPLNPSRARIVGSECRLFHTSYIYLSVTDINDNSPVFSESLFIFAILDSISFNSEVGTIQATDADLALFGEIIYSLPASQEFTIESSTGVLRTNVLFTERAGNVISFDVTATDKAENRSRSTSVNTYVSVLNNDYILRIIVEDTVEVTQLCRNELMSKLVEITSYQVQFYEIKELIIGTTIFPGRTSVLFYAYDIVDGVPTLILQSELIRTIDDSFTDLSTICEGKVSAVSNLVQTSISNPQNPSIQTLIIIVVCLAIFICGCMTNLLALYQRLVGKQRLKQTEEYVYGGMEGLDILTTTQRDVVLNQALVPEELAFESQELKMDLFLDEIPEDEFISGSDRTSSLGGGSLLAKALDMPIDDDDDGDIDSDDFSVSAI